MLLKSSCWPFPLRDTPLKKKGSIEKINYGQGMGKGAKSFMTRQRGLIFLVINNHH